MMEALGIPNAAFLLIAITGLWFFARFVVGPRRGAPGLRSMFARERPVVRTGLGKAAIATLIEDLRRLVADEAGLRGLILAGPFAAEAATSTSSVTILVLADDPALYSGSDWLARWPYPARGHGVLQHQSEASPGEARHQLALRGAPPVVIHFVASTTLDPPPGLKPVLRQGAQTIEDPTGLVDRLRLRWLEAARSA